MRELIQLPPQATSAVLTREGSFRLEEREIPLPAAGEILFRLLAAGLAPNDVAPELYVNRTPPAIPVMEVAALGDEVSGWNPLDRAILLPRRHAPGESGVDGLAEFIRVEDAGEQSGLFKLRQEISAEDATLLPAAATAAGLLRAANLPPGGRLAVLGAGLVGQLLVLLARHQRVAQVFVADASPTLRSKAEWNGATHVIRVPEQPLAKTVAAATGNAGVHAVVSLIPDASQVLEAFAILAAKGSLVLGTPFPGSLLMAFSPGRVQEGELRIIGVNTLDSQDMRAATEAVRFGIVNGENLVSRRYAWDDLPNADLTPEYWTHGTHVVVEAPEH